MAKHTLFFKMELAGRRIEVNCLHRYVFNKCNAYLAHFDVPDFIVGASEIDINFERHVLEVENTNATVTSVKEASKAHNTVGHHAFMVSDVCISYDNSMYSTENKSIINFPDDYYEFFAVCRQIVSKMLDYNTFLMHGAVVAYQNKSFLFTAPSGTGKTTHILQWLDNLPDAFVVNGDKPLIKVTDEAILACGTPWCGKEGLNTNTMVPLKAIVLMERAENNEIEEIRFIDAFPTLLQQTYRPKDADKMRKTLELLTEVGKRVKLYRFRFNNFKDDAFSVAYNALCGNDDQ